MRIAHEGDNGSC